MTIICVSIRHSKSIESIIKEFSSVPAALLIDRSVEGGAYVCLWFEVQPVAQMLFANVSRYIYLDTFAILSPWSGCLVKCVLCSEEWKLRRSSYDEDSDFETVKRKPLSLIKTLIVQDAKTRKKTIFGHRIDSLKATSPKARSMDVTNTGRTENWFQIEKMRIIVPLWTKRSYSIRLTNYGTKQLQSHFCIKYYQNV